MKAIMEAVLLAGVIICAIHPMTARAAKSKRPAQVRCEQLIPPQHPFVGSTVVARSDIMDAILVVDQSGFLELLEVVPMTDQVNCYAVIYRIGDLE